MKRTEHFVPLSQALDIDWTSKKYASQLRRTSPAYFIMQSKTIFLIFTQVSIMKHTEGIKCKV